MLESREYELKRSNAYLCHKFRFMNKRIITGFILASFTLLQACGGNGTAESTTDSDTTAVVEMDENIELEEENALAFDGIEKGDYKLYGHSEIEFSGDETSIEDMTLSIEETGEFDGKVSVNIAEVCQKAGCWITFNDGNGESIRVFFRDHFTIPTETSSGTAAILYGQAIHDTLSVDFQKHLLDDAVENGDVVSQEEYDAITEDLIETTFDCESILVKTAE